MESLPTFDVPIAHRGLHDYAEGVIENSTTAFERAIAAGFAIECDLQLSGDGVPIVFHDSELERLTGQIGHVAALSAGQLTRIPLSGSAAGECPQRFETLLAQVSGRALLVVELKRQARYQANAQLASATAAALKSYGGPLVIESFDPSLLRLMRSYGYRGHLGIILMRDAGPVDGAAGLFAEPVLRHMLHWPMTRFTFISADHTALDLPMLRFWRARGMPVTTWTVRSAEQAKEAKKHADQIVFEGFMPDRG